MVETNELTRKLRTLLHPRAALIVYAEENDNHSYSFELEEEEHICRPAEQED